VPWVIARLGLVGVGTALFMSPNSSQIMGSVPRTMLGTASASVATARNVGNATGLALASTVLTVVAASSSGLSGVKVDDLPASAIIDGVRAAFVAAALASSLAIVASVLRAKRPVPGSAAAPPAVRETASEPGPRG
jgi:MFS family permease